MTSTYTVKFWRVITSSPTIIIPFILVLYMLVTNNGPVSDKIFILISVLFFGGLLGYILIRYLACSNQVLKNSDAEDVFYFGTENNLKKYDKRNIEKITIYNPGGATKMHFFYVYQILFKDKTVIRFSNLLTSNFQNEFPDELITYGLKSPFWMI